MLAHVLVKVDGHAILGRAGVCREDENPPRSRERETNCR
jgi:hypothetical protein